MPIALGIGVSVPLAYLIPVPGVPAADIALEGGSSRLYIELTHLKAERDRPVYAGAVFVFDHFVVVSHALCSC
jgi:hypothetical protein